MTQLAKIDFKEFSKEHLLGLHNQAQTFLSEGEHTKESVHRMYMQIKNARVNIEKLGKAMRDTATQYSRDVMSKQKEYIGYISDDEAKLKQKKDELEHYEKIDKNMHKLEPRKRQLAEYEYDLQEEEYEDVILMTENAFKKMLGDKKEIYLRRKEQELQRKQIDIEKEKAAKEAKEKAIKEMKEEQKLKEEKEAKKIEEAIEKQVEVKDQKGEKLKAELKKIGYNPATDKYKEVNGVYTVYRILGTFTI